MYPDIYKNLSYDVFNDLAPVSIVAMTGFVLVVGSLATEASALVRPVFHYSEQRVRAHVFLCMLAYYVEWHMRGRLKPMLFDDEYLDEASATRASPVLKAVRSGQSSV